MQLDQFAARSLLAISIATFSLPSTFIPDALASAPTQEMQIQLRKGFQAAEAGLLTSANAQLTKSITQWEQTQQPLDEIAALYKTRGVVRAELDKPREALSDFSQALVLMLKPGSQPDPAEIQRTFQLRARANLALGDIKAEEEDLSAAIARLDTLDAIEATNPYLYSERALARMKLTDWTGAADDALQAEVEFSTIGDKIRRLLASADAALALYGSGDVGLALKKMEFVFKNKGTPASNNPDDIGLLQELARKDAELHLAYAAELFSDGASRAKAEEQWNTGCVRLEAFVNDARTRRSEEEALRAAEAQADASGRMSTLRSSSAGASNTPNADLSAALNGLDPNSPYVTGRPQQAYFWYKTSEGGIERRDRGNALADVDERLSCASFRTAEWIRANRPEWPAELANKAAAYAAQVPQVKLS